MWCALTASAPYPALHARFASRLSAEERAREREFERPADRHVYLLAHALARLALASASGVAPDDVEIHARAGGKPHVPGGPQFSLTHAHDASGEGAAAIVVAPDQAVGIDLEAVGRAAELRELVPRRYSADEQRMLGRCDDNGRAERMVWLWTAKEAVIKATGAGLRTPLESISVDWSDDGTLKTAGWYLTRFRLGAFVGTIASAEPPGTIRITQRVGADLVAGTQEAAVVAGA